MKKFFEDLSFPGFLSFPGIPKFCTKYTDIVPRASKIMVDDRIYSEQQIDVKILKISNLKPKYHQKVFLVFLYLF